VSEVGRAVALLAEAVQAGGRAQRGCSTADEHARTMLQLYTEAAEDSGHDAPQSAVRQVSDAQECLLDAANRIHQGAEALHEYVREIAPGLAGAVPTGSEYRPSGTDLVDLAQASAAAKTPRARWLQQLAGGRDDLSDAVQGNADDVEGATRSFHRLPDPPGPGVAESREPRDPSIPVVGQAASEPSAGHAADTALTVATVLLGWKPFWRRWRRWWRS
jgi:hypothetical protein